MSRIFGRIFWFFLSFFGGGVDFFWGKGGFGVFGGDFAAGGGKF